MPISTATPAKPSSTPTTLPGVAFSSLVKRWATRTPQIGVVALRIEARPPLISSCAQANSTNGTTLLRRARTRKANAAPGGMAGLSFRASRKAQSKAAAMATRISTRVKGRTVSSATSMKKKEPPQSTERMSKIAQSRLLIAWLTFTRNPRSGRACRSPSLPSTKRRKALREAQGERRDQSSAAPSRRQATRLPGNCGQSEPVVRKDFVC